MTSVNGAELKAIPEKLVESNVLADAKTVDSDFDARYSSEDETADASGVIPGPMNVEGSLYNLVASSAAHAESGILFAWWPRSNAWNLAQLLERTTRCLPAVRPALDRVALPDISEVHDLWEYWVSLHGLDSNQAIWFPPLLDDRMIADPALATCCMVLKVMTAEHDPGIRVERRGEESSAPSCFYPMYVTQGVVEQAALYSLHVIGDPEDNNLMPLNSAKAWMHPQITGGDEPVASSLRAVLSSRRAVHAPYGYVATTSEDLHIAWVRLWRECPPGTRLVLKPSNGSGGCGVILDATEADLDKFDFNAASSAILEEMVVGCEPVQSPTLYMIGDTPCGFLADQVLSKDGATNLGNKYPSKLRKDLLPVCVEAAQAINQTWKLTSNWGLDFVLNASGSPVIVDLNMGRPNGNFAVRMWASRCAHRLSIFTSSWVVPLNGPKIHDLTDALLSEDLLWNGFDGTIVYQHFVGCECSYAVASTSGDSGLQHIMSKLSTLMLKRFGIDVAIN
jgi:hypothetical protein